MDRFEFSIPGLKSGRFPKLLSGGNQRNSGRIMMHRTLIIIYN